MALARALARSAGKPLYSWLPHTDLPLRLPVPLMSMLAGGANLPNRPAFASFLVCPVGAPSLADAVRASVEVYHALERRLARDGIGLGVSDDGGFWCGLTKPEQALRLIVNAIHEASYPASREGIAIGIDVDASLLHRSDGMYQIGPETLSTAEMISWYTELVDAFPLFSIEDGLGADDTVGWQSLTAALGDRVQLTGDEVICAQPARIQRAADTGIGNAIAVKLDQVGTITQAFEALRLAREAGYGQIVTGNRGETADTFIADMAVASGCGQFAAGAPVRGERVVKYNRLLQISAHTADLPFGLE
jgi:enolase